MTRLHKLTLWFGGTRSEHWFSQRNLIERSVRLTYHRIVSASLITLDTDGSVYFGPYIGGRVEVVVDELPPKGTIIMVEADHL